MPRFPAHEDEWSDEEQDFGPGEDDDDEPTIPCPYCRSEVHEDSQRCPECGHYLSREDSPPAAKPWWVVVGALACLYVVYRWTVPH